MTNDALQILILYAVKEAPMGISPDFICNLISTSTDEGNLNVENCLKDLIEKRLIEEVSIEDNHIVIITENGKLVVNQLQSNVSISLRKGLSKKVFEEVTRLRGELFVSASYKKSPYNEDSYVVSLELKDVEDTLLSMELYAPSQLQAENIVNNFKDSPNDIYSKIIGILSNKGAQD